MLFLKWGITNMKLFWSGMFLIIMFSNSSFGQDVYKAFDIGVYSNQKMLNKADYYLVNGDTASLLPTFKGRIFLDTILFSKKKITFLVIVEKQKIVFKINPDFLYIKIYILKEHKQTKYQISLGLESDYVVTASNRKFVLAGPGWILVPPLSQE
jgi:hypothetical protein